MYNAVGIDVSKGKSTVAVLQPAGVIIRKPFNVNHTSSELDELAKYIGSLEGETRVVLECTGRYHEPVVKTLSEAGLKKNEFRLGYCSKLRMHSLTLP